MTVVLEITRGLEEEVIHKLTDKSGIPKDRRKLKGSRKKVRSRCCFMCSVGNSLKDLYSTFR